MNEKRTVTVMQANPSDPFLKAIANIIEGEQEWPPSSDNNMMTAEDRRKANTLKLFTGFDQVDLVGHTTPIQHYLKLGDWLLDPVAAARLASYMPDSVTSVRLIGCQTATKQGAVVLKVLAQVLAQRKASAQREASAWGTIGNIYTTHFDKKGVKRGKGEPGLREFHPNMEPQPVKQPPVLQKALDMLRQSVSAVTSLPAMLRWLWMWFFANREIPYRWVRWLLSPQGIVMDLATEPLFIFKIPSRSQIWTLEILFDFEYARYYSDASSVTDRQRVYKIRRASKQAEKSPLERYLETLQNFATLSVSHEEAGNRFHQVRKAKPLGPVTPAPDDRLEAVLVRIKRATSSEKNGPFNETQPAAPNSAKPQASHN